MVEIAFVEGLVISMLVGALLGLEREYTKKQGVIGLRTFSLVALFGYLAVVLSNMLSNDILIFLGFIIVAGFSIILYVSGTLKVGEIGFTTNISVVITYLLGILVGFGWRTESIFLAVLVSIVLFSKERMHKLVSRLNHKEIGDLLEFLVLLGIIYPILPATIDVLGVTVPLLMIWGIIVIISILNFFVFIGTRYLPVRHKIELFGFLGALLNTQAIIGSLMNVYRQNKRIFQNVASGFILINSAMYLRNFIIVSIIAPALIIYVGPAILLVFVTLIPFSRLFTLMKHKEADIKVESPFGVWPAVKLGMAILVVFLILDFSSTLSGDAFILTSVLGGLVYSLAVCVSIGTMVVQGGISLEHAAFAFVLTNIASVVSNYFVLYISGGKDVIDRTYKAIAISLVASMLGVALPLLILA